MNKEIDRSKIGKSNVRRGKSYERTVAKFLTDYTGEQFRRRKVEGRDATILERESAADVIPVTGEILFSIEVKCGECPALDGLLANPLTNKITKWWHQATYDATLLTDILIKKPGKKRADYMPLLFFKPGRGFNWIAVDHRAFTDGLLRPSDKYMKPGIFIEEYKKPWMPHLAFSYSGCGPIEHDVSHSGKHKNLVSLELPDLYFIRWNDFAAQVDPASIFV